MPLSIELRTPPALDLSIVVPLRDEAGNLDALAREVEQAMADCAFSWECIWVDDGSADGSLDELWRIVGRDGRHRVLVLDRNHGQSAAMTIGFAHARGRLLATLDADRQSDPADLPRLVAHLDRGGLDLVNGWRERRHDSRVRKLSSRIANGFRNRVTHEAVRDVGCSVRVMRREAVDGIPVFHGMHRFLPTLVRMNGHSRIDELPVNHRPRARGRSKYGIHDRLWVGIGDTLMIRWLWRRSVAPSLADTRPVPGTPAFAAVEALPVTSRHGVAEVDA